jgi:hypothetical protein
MMVGQSDTELLASDDAELFGVFYERHLDAVVAISTTSHLARRWRGSSASRVIC